MNIIPIILITSFSANSYLAHKNETITLEWVSDSDRCVASSIFDYWDGDKPAVGMIEITLPLEGGAYDFILTCTKSSQTSTARITLRAIETQIAHTAPPVTRPQPPGGNGPRTRTREGSGVGGTPIRNVPSGCPAPQIPGRSNDWFDVFKDSPPQISGRRSFYASQGEYRAIPFVASASSAVGYKTSPATGSSYIRLISISECPGVFDPNQIGFNCVNGNSLGNLGIDVDGSRPGGCPLVSGKTYYFNLVFSSSYSNLRLNTCDDPTCHIGVESY